ncbi:MAG: hypothetical protein AAFS07_17735 [Pseudomonadota bacterium]
MLIPLHDDAAAFTTITFALTGQADDALAEGTLVCLIDAEARTLCGARVLTRSAGYSSDTVALTVAAVLTDGQSATVRGLRPTTVS